jgi:hypothetical protein
MVLEMSGVEGDRVESEGCVDGRSVGMLKEK